MFTYHGVTIAANEILKYSRKSRTDDPLMTVEEILEKHEKILNEWCERNLGELIPENNSFKEIVSGETIQARPEFQKILRLIESAKYKAVLCVEVQRLSRGDLEDAGRLIKLLRYTNTFVITSDMVFDLNDEYDRERFKRELERGNDYLEYYKKISWRGRLEAVKAGYFIGSQAPFGYDRTTIMDGRKKRYTLQINEREAELVRLIFDMYANQNIGMYMIARHLNDMGYKPRKNGLWVASSIKGILANEHYIGKIRWDYRKHVTTVEDGEIIKVRPRHYEYYLFDGKHPAIISEELFNQAKEKMGTIPRVKKDKKLQNAFAGLLYCECGLAMAYRNYKNKDGKECALPRLLCHNQIYCQNQSVTYDEIINNVVEVLKSCIADFEIKIKNDSENTLLNHNNAIKRLETRLEELNNKELMQWEKYTEGSMPKAIFDKLNEKVLQEKENVTQALTDAKTHTPTVDNYQEKMRRFTDALNGLQDPNVSIQAKNTLLKACIERMTYKREKGTRWAQTEYELDIVFKE